MGLKQISTALCLPGKRACETAGSKWVRHRVMLSVRPTGLGGWGV